MKISNQIIILLAFIILANSACKKNFLDAKPSTTILAPSTLSELQGLLENSIVLNQSTPGLGQMACDDYVFVDYKSWQAAQTATERNSYIWSKDIFEGAANVKDWNSGYTTIFYCNNILETLTKIQLNDLNEKQYNSIKGAALFIRAYALYDLVRTYSPAYDLSTASTDLGLPIRLSAGIDVIVPRSSVKETYDQILMDLSIAKSLLDLSVSNNNRPTKAAAYALFSRIYLSMRDYVKAESYADSTLALNKKLIDYNTISKTATTPFALNNDETIYNTSSVPGTYLITANSTANTQVTINPDLIKLYDPNDLRLTVFFRTNATTGNLYERKGYFPQIVPFTGLATDEIYLIKAECLARRNEFSLAMSWLNSLLIKRFSPVNFKALNASNQTEAVDRILLERRKELVWRTLRWSDLKRLNKEGRNITLVRLLNGVTYTLPPNDPRYVLPIPDDEIALSGIQQNIR